MLCFVGDLDFRALGAVRARVEATRPEKLHYHKLAPAPIHDDLSPCAHAVGFSKIAL